MIVWQVKYSNHDVNHKQFVIATDRFELGKTKKPGPSIRTFSGVSARGYYFYMEFLK